MSTTKTSTPKTDVKSPAVIAFERGLTMLKSRKRADELAVGPIFLATCQGNGVIQKAGNVLYNTNLIDATKVVNTVAKLHALKSSDETEESALNRLMWEALNECSVQFSVFPDHKGDFPMNGDEIRLQRTKDYTNEETGETKVNIRFQGIKPAEHAPSVQSSLIDDLLAELG